MGDVKHTPGPWKIVFASGRYPYQIDAPNGSKGPGGIRFITRWGAISMPSSAEGLANARLIAASPDLLEALQGLLKTYLQAADSGDCGNWDARAEPQVIAALAAIAKATGPDQ